MIIGVPREIKRHEYRIALVPEAVAALVARGHRLVIEKGAGADAGFEDRAYEQAGAEILPDGEAVFAAAEMVVKVKEPLAEECRRLRPDQVLFAYLHLAANPEQAALLRESGAACLAFETLRDGGSLPLLTPMSEIAGRLAAQAGAVSLQRDRGGRGILLSGAGDLEPGRVVVIGGGTVGRNAAWVASRLGAEVTVLERSPEKLGELSRFFDGAVICLPSTPESIAGTCASADLLIGAVLVAGARTPRIVTRSHLRSMPRRSVFVDVAIDQGGCSETSRMTTYDDPTYEEEGVIHYCVGNMPGAVPRTASRALSRALLPYLLSAAEHGRAALSSDPALRSAINIDGGEIINAAVREALADSAAGDSG